MATPIEKDAYPITINPPKDIINHEIDADDALRVLKDYGEADIVLDAPTNRRLLRRIDLMLMPVRCAPYFEEVLTNLHRYCVLCMDSIT